MKTMKQADDLAAKLAKETTIIAETNGHEMLKLKSRITDLKKQLVAAKKRKKLKQAEEKQGAKEPTLEQSNEQAKLNAALGLQFSMDPIDQAALQQAYNAIMAQKIATQAATLAAAAAGPLNGAGSTSDVAAATAATAARNAAAAAAAAAAARNVAANKAQAAAAAAAAIRAFDTTSTTTAAEPPTATTTATATATAISTNTDTSMPTALPKPTAEAQVLAEQASAAAVAAAAATGIRKSGRRPRPKSFHDDDIKAPASKRTKEADAAERPSAKKVATAATQKSAAAAVSAEEAAVAYSRAVSRFNMMTTIHSKQQACIDTLQLQITNLGKGISPVEMPAPPYEPYDSYDSYPLDGIIKAF